MQLILHIETKGVPAAILDAAYAFFPPYKFTDSGNGILSTTIDAAHDLTDEQWAIVVQMNPTVDLVLPAGLTKSAPVVASFSTASPPSSPISPTPEVAGAQETAPIPVVGTTNSGPITGTMTLVGSTPISTPPSITNTPSTQSSTVVLG